MANPYPVPDHGTLAWIRAVLGADPGTPVALTGGTAQAVWLVPAADGREYVMRQWSRPGWRESDPHHSPENELAALTALAATGLPVPEVVACDAAGEHGDHPALLMTRLPGHIASSATYRVPGDPPMTPDMIRQLTEAAQVVHGLAVPAVGPYEPYGDLSGAEPPEGTSRPELWELAFETVLSGPPAAPEVFVHRDFHPGNTLWLDGRLSGLIDWTTAARGPAGVDYGHLRWNLVAAYGLETAGSVLRHAPDYHPYWDLRTVADAAELVEDLPLFERYLDSVLSRI
ncbi:phosphotransferase family protein [Longispora albida]|uniref:phosphotransferase family protein n=1 Tax=Longispora albida TaxID=203523 RepID=UPI000375E888|nr:aminoglycoside phosphotransferase family protein [Longispora albida]